VCVAHAQVVRAADFAAAAHAGQTRRTGEAYVTHAVETARIMAGLVPSSSSRSVAAVVAALLHDVVDDTATTLEDVAAAFGAEVATLVDGVTRLSQLNQLLRRHRRLEMVEGAWATAAPSADVVQGSVSGALAPSDVATLRALILSMVDDPRVVLLKLADRHGGRAAAVCDALA
jgi:(p)ppGpp synthase/HD superfamily hydrolase